MNTGAEELFALLRAALSGRMDEADRFAACDEARWRAIYHLSSEQGVLAMAWDAVRMLPAGLRPPRELELQWAVNVDRMEEVYRRQERALARLAGFFRSHGLRLMILKGYGLSLFYPVPQHRPCGDLDIWLFGRQPEGDRLVAAELGIAVDVHKEHHTTFRFEGIPVENHYDFVNVETHASNRALESLLKRLAAEPGPTTSVGGVSVFLPPVPFNALFLLRHTASHFAAARIGLRHLTDWAVFVGSSRAQIDWAALYDSARRFGLEVFLDCMNGLCIDRLGLDPSLFPPFERRAETQRRVENEVLSPEFSEEAPDGLLPIVRFKIRRWWANRWKHRMVYEEPLAGAFLRSVWAHLKRPRSICAK